jgi:hypothetical protein
MTHRRKHVVGLFAALAAMPPCALGLTIPQSRLLRADEVNQ